MGVPGLWDILRPAGEVRSLTHLAVVDGFEANPAGARGFRVGIDASIWFFHATYGREGENPELRTLFFRCSRLMSMPFLPLFVFDGPKRPEFKRGKRVSGKNNWMEQGMQEIIHAFGFEWRKAPGEAEAELAYLNKIGVIDAVLSDDVDTFLFGATMVVRNPSVTLSGNRGHSLKNAAGRDDGNHVATYKSSVLAKHSSIRLTQGGMILFGILCGGDYHQAGLMGCGATTAHGLAKCGFGDSLLEAARNLPRDVLPEFLATWREDLRQELRTNSKGHLGRKMPSLAKKIPEDFPNVEVLLSYTNPVTSESRGKTAKDFSIDWEKEPDLGRVAGLCEMYFEWGIREIIIKRFRTVLWPSAVLRILRRSVLLADKKASRASAGLPSTPRKNPKDRLITVRTPSKMIAKHFSQLELGTPRARSWSAESDTDAEETEEPLVVKIHSTRTHASTGGVLEYRLEIAPAQLVRICEAGVRGLRTALPADLSDSAEEDEDEDGPRPKGKGKKPPPDPMSHLRVWLPACMVRLAEPELVDNFEAVQAMKQAKKAAKGSRTKTADAASKTQKMGSNSHKETTKKPAMAPLYTEKEEESSASEPATPVKKAAPKKATKTAVRMPLFAEEEESSSSSPATPAKKTVAAQRGKGLSKMPTNVPRSPTNAHAGTNGLRKAPIGPRERPSKKGGEPAAAKTMPGFFAHTKPGATQTKGKGRVASSTAKVSALFGDSSSSALSGSQSRTTGRLNSLYDDSNNGQSLYTVVTSSGLPSPSPSKQSSLSTRSSSAILSALGSDILDKPVRPTPTAPASRYAPRPFPLSFDTESYNISELEKDDPFGVIATLRRDKMPPLARRGCSSGSDIPDEVPPRKSPRKSTKHASPRSSRVSTPQRHDPEAQRAVSPSPMRPRPGALTGRALQAKPKATVIPADVSIISISSDSEPDAPVQARKLAPLQLVRTRSKPPAAPAMDRKAGTRRRVLDYDPNDIIDLT